MSATQEEDKKPGDEGEARIILKVTIADGQQNIFSMQRSAQLKKLMNAFCDHNNKDLESFIFLFDGRRLCPEQTPDEMEMKSRQSSIRAVDPYGLNLFSAFSGGLLKTVYHEKV